RPGGPPGDRSRGPQSEGVRAAGVLHAASGRGAPAGDDRRARVGSAGRGGLEPAGGLRAVPPGEGRSAVRAFDHRDRARRRVPAARRRWRRIVSLRTRLTIGFAVGMAVVLAALGFFLDWRVGPGPPAAVGTGP